MTEDGSSPENLIRHSSGHLLRDSFNTVTGGAVVLPPAPDALAPDETVPLRQSGATPRRRATLVQGQRIQDRLAEELMSFVRRNWVWLLLLAFIVGGLCIFMLYCFIEAVVAVCYFHAKPCDQPLKLYLLVSLAWSQLPERIVRCLQHTLRLSTLRTLALTIVMYIPGWCIIAWGVYMVTHAKTCQNTNPELFWPTRQFIIMQCIYFACVTPLGIICLVLGVQHVLLILSKLNVKPGCEAAVRKLPTVEEGSELLKDPADNTFIECPICFESLVGNGDVVCAPCDHYFHRECLATWCQNHVDCPLCRHQVGEIDSGRGCPIEA